ncbi:MULTISPECIES: peptide deformylase [Paenibacillus]|uniref:Peptide deformylase n=1 Tax=Paenibacillus albilobatus TaxID=2716884 RepID=A0A919XAZ1_9BACL|nr:MULTISPECIES: peptide deformylase [Paenibacillus]GIO29119.1 peptide deformylase [Paenibacillus albilobatus]
MAEREIVPFGDPVLRKIAKPVTELTPKMLRILDDLVDTLYAEDGRAGLAAPQIGFLRRMVVMDCGEGLIELINPEILEKSGEQIGPEACLSYPGYSGIVKRADYVKVRTLTRAGESVVLEGTGYLARCIQHEIDHLDGVLFIDRIEGDQFYHEPSKQKADLLKALKLTQK